MAGLERDREQGLPDKATSVFCFLETFFFFSPIHKHVKILFLSCGYFSCFQFLFSVFFFLILNFYFYFISLYNTVLVLAYTDMNPPRVYMSLETFLKRVRGDVKGPAITIIIDIALLPGTVS